MAEHTQEWWRDRIRQLDSKVCNSGKELQETVSKLVEAHANLARAVLPPQSCASLAS